MEKQDQEEIVLESNAERAIKLTCHVRLFVKRYGQYRPSEVKEDLLVLESIADCLEKEIFDQYPNDISEKFFKGQNQRYQKVVAKQAVMSQLEKSNSHIEKHTSDAITVFKAQYRNKLISPSRRLTNQVLKLIFDYVPEAFLKGKTKMNKVLLSC